MNCLVWIYTVCKIILARLDEVQEELLYYPSFGIGIGIGGGVSKMLKFLRLSFLCDGQGAVRQAILSL